MALRRLFELRVHDVEAARRSSAPDIATERGELLGCRRGLLVGRLLELTKGATVGLLTSKREERRLGWVAPETAPELPAYCRGNQV